MNEIIIERRKTVYKISLLILSVILSGCGPVLTEFSRRSDLTLGVNADNSGNVVWGNRKVDVTVHLHGNNRDMLASYEKALEFSLKELGLEALK